MAISPENIEWEQVNLGVREAFTKQSLPNGWLPNQKPSPALPIDEFISNLISPSRQSRLRLQKDFKDCEWTAECPYFFARSRIANAFLYANHQVRLDESRIRALTALANLKSRMEGLESEIASAAKSASALLRTNEDVPFELYSLRDMAEALAYSHILIGKNRENIGRLHVDLSQNRGNVWRISFVTSLGVAWYCLVRKKPSASGRFPAFMDAALASVSDALAPVVDWTSSIKTARKRVNGEWTRPSMLGRDVGDSHVSLRNMHERFLVFEKYVDALREGDRLKRMMDPP